ncbi:MAG: PAS domain S-box protein, partial [Methanospirillaceae archaeon]|nr:PAS domain S-box protein [Methanospirillaceae archaeon]
QQYEYVITNAAGETFDVMFSKTALMKADGTVGGIVGVIFDISDRKLAEQEVSEKLNYVKALMDSMASPVFLRDRNGVYEDCNKAFEELVGMSKNEIIGKTIHDFFPKELADHYRHKDDLIIEKPHVQQYEYVITNAAGETQEVLFSKTALLKADGTVGGIVGVIFDISDRKKLERALEESAEKFRTLAEFTYDWESWIGPDGSYIYVSPSCHRISGYMVKDFMQDPDLLITITHPDDQEMIEHHYHSVGAVTDTIQHIDFRIITKSGEERWISHYCQPVFREDGSYLGRRENKRDITQRKQVEAALQRANQKLNLISGVTRHDVLNQLTVLAGYADLARESAREKEAIEYIDRIRGTVETITNQISFTRIYQDIGLHIAGWQDVSAVIQKSLEFIHIKEVSISDRLKKLELYADPLLEKVLYSFLDNSQRHGKHVTRVSFDMEFCDDGILFIYEDNGIGIPDADKEKIFESGYGQNTGYGLFLSREILGISDYTLTEAGTYGKGVKFIITIPQGMFRFKND